mgnify:CR=1 FL=1
MRDRDIEDSFIWKIFFLFIAVEDEITEGESIHENKRNGIKECPEIIRRMKNHIDEIIESGTEEKRSE